MHPTSPGIIKPQCTLSKLGLKQKIAILFQLRPKPSQVNTLKSNHRIKIFKRVKTLNSNNIRVIIGIHISENICRTEVPKLTTLAQNRINLWTSSKGKNIIKLCNNSLPLHILTMFIFSRI